MSQPNPASTPSTDSEFGRCMVKCPKCGTELKQITRMGKPFHTDECPRCHPKAPRPGVGSTSRITDVVIPCPGCGKNFEAMAWDGKVDPAARCRDCDRKAREEAVAAKEVERKEAAAKAKAEREEARRQREMQTDDEYGQIDLGIPKQYHGAWFTECAGATKLGAWVDVDGGGEGIVTMTGPAGTGKTRALYALVRFLHRKGWAWSKWRVPALAKHLQALGNKPDEEEAELKKLMEDPNHLLLDDLGVEKVTPYVLQDLYLILAEREEWGRPTVITTNLTLDQLAEKFDDRVASRLAGGLVIRFGEGDRRLTKGAKHAQPRQEPHVSLPSPRPAGDPKGGSDSAGSEEADGGERPGVAVGSAVQPEVDWSPPVPPDDDIPF